MSSKNNIIKKLFTLFAVIFITALTASNLYAQPSWDAAPTMTNITALNGVLTVDFDVNCTVYYMVNRYVAPAKTGEQIKDRSSLPHDGNSGGFRGGGSFAYPAGGSITHLVEHLVPTDLGSYTHTIHIVAETTPDNFSPVQFAFFTTTNCPDVLPATSMAAAQRCVNGVGSTQTYQFFTSTGILAGADWIIDWGNGSPDYTITSTTNGELPAPFPSYTETSHDSCFYDIILTIRVII